MPRKVIGGQGMSRWKQIGWCTPGRVTELLMAFQEEAHTYVPWVDISTTTYDEAG
jgi:hypothetical protein